MTFVEKAFHANGSGGVHKNWSTLKIGKYVKDVKRWLKNFPLRQMHFVSGENLLANPAEEVQKVTDFLNLFYYIFLYLSRWTHFNLHMSHSVTNLKVVHIPMLKKSTLKNRDSFTDHIMKNVINW